MALERETYGRADKKGPKELRDEIVKIIEDLDNFPHVAGLRKEPFPPNTVVNAVGWTLHKLEFSCPRANGPHRQGRLMVLVNLAERLVVPFAIYTHGQYRGRVPDGPLKELVIKVVRASQPVITVPASPQLSIVPSSEKK